MRRQNQESQQGRQIKSQNRRKFLSVGGGILSTFIVGGDIWTNSTKIAQIKIAEGSNGPIYQEVPQKWKDHLETVKRVREKVSESHSSHNNVVSIAIKSGQGDISGQGRLQVVIKVQNEGLLGFERPEVIDGINIAVEEVEDRTLSSACHGNKDFQTIQGGVKIEDESYSGSFGTLGGLVEYGGELMGITNYHVADPSDEMCDFDSIIEDSITQHGQELGRVYAADRRLDMALIQITNDNLNTSDFIYEEGGNQTEIASYYTKNGINYLISGGDEVTHTGVASGTTSGPIEEIGLGTDDCAGWQNEGFRAKVPVSGGDSGGLVYKIPDGQSSAIIVGLFNSSSGSINETTCDGENLSEFAYGAAAYEINNDWGIPWGT